MPAVYCYQPLHNFVFLSAAKNLVIYVVYVQYSSTNRTPKQASKPRKKITAIIHPPDLAAEILMA